MSRNGKIARLPLDIRSQLNHRLIDNRPASEILEWVNALPETLELLQAHFDGIPISPQNLSEWRAGGFAEAQAWEDLLVEAMDLDRETATLEAVPHRGNLIDRAATLLSMRHLQLANTFPLQPDEKFEARFKLLERMTRSVALLQRSIHRACAQNDQAQDRKKRLRDEKFEQHTRRIMARLDGPLVVRKRIKEQGGGKGVAILEINKYATEHHYSDEERQDLRHIFLPDEAESDELARTHARMGKRPGHAETEKEMQKHHRRQRKLEDEIEDGPEPGTDADKPTDETRTPASGSAERTSSGTDAPTSRPTCRQTKSNQNSQPSEGNNATPPGSTADNPERPNESN